MPFRHLLTLIFPLLSISAFAQTYVNMSSPAITASGMPGCNTSSANWSWAGNTGSIASSFQTCTFDITINFTTAGATTLNLTEIPPACPNVGEIPCTILGSHWVYVYVDGTLVGNAHFGFGTNSTHSVSLASGGAHTIRYNIQASGLNMQFRAYHNSPMPVNITQWEVNNNVANWHTIMEKDILWYTVEGSHNGTDFTVLDTVYANNKNIPQQYELALQPGYSYFRLGVKEINEAWYSSVVTDGTSITTEAFLFPTPSNNGILTVSCNKSIDAIEVCDIQGNKELHKTHTFATQLRGILLVKLYTQDEVILKKVIVE